jgi:hypothetical protein
LRKRVNFTISAPYELKNSDIVLPPGNYVLYQVTDNSPHLFALYRDSTRHSPIATISTVRIDYSPNKYPSRATMLMETDELSSSGNPVLEGWNIPGEDGWQAISSVTRHHAGVRIK